MKIDLYSKCVLTIIAGCLVYFVARDLNLVADAHAQSRGVVDVNIVRINGSNVAFSSATALPVRIAQ